MCKPLPKTRESLFNHAKKRLLERYGIVLTQQIYDFLQSKIKNKDALFLKTESNTRRHLAIRLEGKWIPVVYNTSLNAIATFLPQEALNEHQIDWELADQRIKRLEDTRVSWQAHSRQGKGRIFSVEQYSMTLNKAMYTGEVVSGTPIGALDVFIGSRPMLKKAKGMLKQASDEMAMYETDHTRVTIRAV